MTAYIRDSKKNKAQSSSGMRLSSWFEDGRFYHYDVCGPAEGEEEESDFVNIKQLDLEDTALEILLTNKNKTYDGSIKSFDFS